jgi:glycine/serine hydroxymethyltransferase
VANARALAAALARKGFRVVAADRGYTRTHQVFLDLGGDAQRFHIACQAANVMLTDSALPGDIARKQRTGVRIGVHEPTYLGMKEAQMLEIARLMTAAFRGGDPAQLTQEVAALVAPYSSYDPFAGCM